MSKDSQTDKKESLNKKANAVKESDKNLSGSNNEKTERKNSTIKEGGSSKH